MRGQKWTKAENSKLIVAYKKHPVLYNKTHPDYNSPNDRENALMYIVDEVQDVRPGTLMPEVKRRITNLRTQYFRQKKLAAEAAERGEPLRSKLWCFNDLQFIEDETLLEDPLDMASFKNTTWFPDIDDDSLSELSYSAETENIKPHENGCDTEIASSPQLVEIIEDIQPATPLPEEELSSALIDQQKVELLDSDLNESADEFSAETSMNCLENSTPPEKPIVQTKIRKRRIQNSQASTKIVPKSSTNLKKASVSKPKRRRSSNSSNKEKELENKLNSLDSVTSKAYELIASSTDSNHANNRAFVENLLYDLDELSGDILQRVKWQITNEVYEVFHGSNAEQKTKKPKTHTKIK